MGKVKVLLRALPLANKPIQLPDQFPLTLSAFLTGLQVVQKSRQVQLLAHLNPEVVEVFSDLDLLEIPFLFISRDRRGFENCGGLLVVNGTSEFSWSLTVGEMENGHCCDASACHR